MHFVNVQTELPLKAYKKWTDCSLREAKDFVESLPRNETQATDSATKSADDQQVNRILDAIQRGQTREATKIHRETNQVTRWESKEFVEHLMSELAVEETGGRRAKLVMLAVNVSMGTPIPAN